MLRRHRLDLHSTLPFSVRLELFASKPHCTSAAPGARARYRVRYNASVKIFRISDTTVYHFGAMRVCRWKYHLRVGLFHLFPLTPSAHRILVFYRLSPYKYPTPGLVKGRCRRLQRTFPLLLFFFFVCFALARPSSIVDKPNLLSRHSSFWPLRSFLLAVFSLAALARLGRPPHVSLVIDIFLTSRHRLQFYASLPATVTRLAITNRSMLSPTAFRPT